MNIVEFQLLTEDDGLANTIENIDTEGLDDSILASMCDEVKYALEQIKDYIFNRIEENKNDDCICD